MPVLMVVIVGEGTWSWIWCPCWWPCSWPSSGKCVKRGVLPPTPPCPPRLLAQSGDTRKRNWKKKCQDVASCPERLLHRIKYSNIYLFRGINLSNVASEAPKISPNGIQISPGLRFSLRSRGRWVYRDIGKLVDPCSTMLFLTQRSTEHFWAICQFSILLICNVCQRSRSTDAMLWS